MIAHDPLKIASRRWLIVVVLAGALAACHNRSEDYERLRETPPDEWVTFASSLPIEQRLDLHLKVQRSSHNPPHRITEAFSEEPLKTYRALVERIQAGDANHHYLGVLFELDRSPSFSICEQPDRKIVQDYLWGIATGAVRPEHRPNFYRC